MKEVHKLLLGRVLTNIGDSIVLISLTWYVAVTYHNTLYLGIIGVIVGVIDVFMFFLGPILDRYNIRKILCISTLAQVFIVILMSLYFLLDHHHLLILYILLSMSTLFSSVIYPAESVLIPKLSTDARQVVKYNAIFQMTYKGLDVVLDALVGVLLSIFLIVNIFSFNVIIFVVAFFVFKLLRLNSTTIHHKDNIEASDRILSRYLADLKEGMIYVSRPKILKLLLPLSIINFSLSAVTVIYPKIAVLEGNDSKVFSLILFVNGLGLILGYLVGPRIIRYIKFSKLLFSSFFILFIIWLCIYLFINVSYVYILPMFLVSNIMIGIINLAFINAFQLLPPQNMLGRVATTNETLLSILIPFGAFTGGILPQLFGTININFILVSIACLVISIFYVIDKDIKKMNDLMMTGDEQL
ncbi:MFS transporter [Staphylococcus pseudintermedius]|nr:MFS transporter [Staphylococcus pseudintermedius]EGQ3502669.1 MFS transporter [Staphylococcus pseudintermedius]